MAGTGGGYIPQFSDSLKDKLERAREVEKRRLDQDVDRMLREELIRYNDRDTAKTNDRLADIMEALGKDVDIETLLLGGSVAKHTYVDGLSDVDALIILEGGKAKLDPPQEILDRFHQLLQEKLSRKDIESVSKGALAVTVQYRDASEVQLLPAVRSRDVISIPNASAGGWNSTNPATFRKEITRYNERLNGALVPTIKLVKSLVSDLPKQQQATGYHIEALALDGARRYKGPATPKALLISILRHAAENVVQPIKDVTGQSRNVDDYLGPANSSERRLVSQALSGIQRRLNAATSVAQWRAMFGKVEK